MNVLSPRQPINSMSIVLYFPSSLLCALCFSLFASSSKQFSFSSGRFSVTSSQMASEKTKSRLKMSMNSNIFSRSLLTIDRCNCRLIVSQFNRFNRQFVFISRFGFDIFENNKSFRLNQNAMKINSTSIVFSRSLSVPFAIIKSKTDKYSVGGNSLFSRSFPAGNLFLGTIEIHFDLWLKSCARHSEHNCTKALWQLWPFYCRTNVNSLIFTSNKRCNATSSHCRMVFMFIFIAMTKFGLLNADTSLLCGKSQANFISFEWEICRLVKCQLQCISGRSLKLAENRNSWTSLANCAAIKTVRNSLRLPFSWNWNFTKLRHKLNCRFDLLQKIYIYFV